MLADWYHVPSQLASAVPCINQKVCISSSVLFNYFRLWTHFPTAFPPKTSNCIPTPSTLPPFQNSPTSHLPRLLSCLTIPIDAPTSLFLSRSQLILYFCPMALPLHREPCAILEYL